jgi:hypothetical protein
MIPHHVKTDTSDVRRSGEDLFFGNSLQKYPEEFPGGKLKAVSLKIGDKPAIKSFQSESFFENLPPEGLGTEKILQKGFEKVHLHSLLMQHLEKAVEIVLGLLEPKNVIKEEVIFVLNGKPIQLLSGTVHHRPFQYPVFA